MDLFAAQHQYRDSNRFILLMLMLFIVCFNYTQLLTYHLLFDIINIKKVNLNNQMTLKEELINRFQIMDTKMKDLNLTIEKYRQQTQYVCLKTGVSDWMTFLTQIRMGKIGYRNKQNLEISPKDKNNSAMGLLNDLFQNISTNRSTGRQQYCQCESPVCSQGTIKRIKGGDTQRSDTNNSVESSCQKLTDKNDPFNRYKIESILEPREKMQEESIQQILRYIQKYQIQKSMPLQGFDTFRKIGQKDQNLNETRENNDSAQKSGQLSSERRKVQPLSQTHKIENQFKPFWKNKQNFPLQFKQWHHQPQMKQKQSLNEYTLAIENTRLRRQLKQLESKLYKQ